MTADTVSFGGNESSKSNRWLPNPVSVLKIIVMYTFSLSSTFFFFVMYTLNGSTAWLVHYILT